MTTEEYANRRATKRGSPDSRDERRVVSFGPGAAPATALSVGTSHWRQ